MNASILLVEGTSGVGKSSLLRHLLARHVQEEERPRTLVYLSQASTYFPLASPDLPVLPGKRQQREHLRRVLRMLEPASVSLQPARWFTLFGLIDTLHLTHAFRPGVLSWAELRYVDSYLADRGVRMVFLQASASTLWERLIVGRGPEFLDYQRKFGHTPEEVHAYYVREQEAMRELVRKSRLETLVLRAEEELEVLAERGYGFWKGPSASITHASA